MFGYTKMPTFHKSMMLRFFVHLVGDMHQPLHVTTRATTDRPEGDKGGNLFKLNYKINNLHSLWDQAMGMIPQVNRVPAFLTRSFSL